MRPAYVRYGSKVNPVVCGRKHCTGCGRWRHAVDFAAHDREPKLVLSSRCRACQRAYVAGVMADPTRAAQRRRYNRQWQQRHRRAEGQLPWPEYTQKIAKAVPILGRKHCTQCGRWRPVSDFGHHRDGITASCLACLRIAQRGREKRTKADPVKMALRREYQRIWREAQRRKAGIKPRPLTRPLLPDPPRNGDEPDYLHRRVSAAPLRPHLLAWLRAYASEHPTHGGGGTNGTRPEHRGLRALAHASTVPERRLYGLLVGEYPSTHYAVADRLAVAMDLPLALIYEGQA